MEAWTSSVLVAALTEPLAQCPALTGAGRLTVARMAITNTRSIPHVPVGTDLNASHIFVH